tara:strand:+ start:282 stop:1172 length:891 start_codon:yes stop_codon:yes gene_type:complete
MERDVIVSIDIGGTNFETGILNKESLAIIGISSKNHIRNYINSESLFEGVCLQIKNLLDKYKVDDTRIYGISVACPGPLDVKKGIILNTLNLKLFRNYPLRDKLKERFNCKISIENDANLFALGEWFLGYKEENIFVGITLGTGLGFGLVINKQMFTGKNGMAGEYSMSPFDGGIWEDKICLKYIKSEIKRIYGEAISPRIIEEYAIDGDSRAKSIFDEFGNNIGFVLSHIINMLDPGVIVFGGGLSNAFNIYEKKMIETINDYCPSFQENPCAIHESTFKSKSHMVGAAINLKKK